MKTWNMKVWRRMLVAMLFALGVMLTIGCDDTSDGLADDIEEVGDDISDAVQDAGDEIEDATDS